MSKRFCTNCGQELSADAKFCPNCGMGVQQQQTAETYAAPAAVDSVPAPAVPEVPDPKAGKKRQKKEQVDYEALLMANMPIGVRQRKPFATLALAGISILVSIIMLCATGSFNPDPEIYIQAGAAYRSLILEGQLWRLVTGTFLHFGLQHLLFNMLCLFALGRFLEKVAGHANLLCVYLLTACTGGLLSMAFHGRDVCAGASGAVFGVFGASVSLVALLWRKYHIDPKHMWGYMKNGLAFVSINFIYSLFPGVDMAGHIGGLLGGLAVGAVVAVPLLMDGKPFAKWFQRGFWGVSALLTVILACTTACGVKARGFGGGSSSSSSSSSSNSSSGNGNSAFASYKREGTTTKVQFPSASSSAMDKPAFPVRENVTKPIPDSAALQKESAQLADADIKRFAAALTPEVVRKLRTEAERGDANAQCRLAECYENALGVEKDMGEAIRWYHKAAEQGLAEAQNNIGDIFLNGHGVAKDEIEAVKWFRKAAEQGDVTAQHNLGFCYGEGHGVERNQAEAFRWFHKAAEKGNAGAQYNLGLYYEDGIGVERNLSEAVRWYRKAAEQGFAAAQNTLGEFYKEGNGVPPDSTRAVFWYRKAAEQGYAIAQHNLGFSYEKGLGVEKDEFAAADWYRKAAEQGLAASQKNLGLCYIKGKGVEKNIVEAERWLRKAAEQGHEGAVKVLRFLESSRDK